MVDIIHEGGGCEFVVKQGKVHVYLCENKPTHVAIGEGGEEKKCCAEHGATWLEDGFLVDLVLL